jgi:ADP-heptose:LPS heptosyltransferase
MAPEKILIFRQSSLGDVILALTVVNCLKGKFPAAQIDFITKEQYLPVIQHHPSIRMAHGFASNGELVKIIGNFGNVSFDYYIDLQSNIRSILLGLSLGKVSVLRYKKRRLARMMIVRRPQRKLAVEHTVLAYQKCLASLGIEPTMSVPDIHLPEAAIRSAEEFYRSYGIAKGVAIAICPGAKHVEKRWPWSEFKELALRFLGAPNSRIIVISARNDEIPENLGIQNSRLVHAIDLPITQVAAVLAGCRLAITNDSGLMHLANAVGTKVLAIFGPTNPRLGFAPADSGSRIICDDVPCSPCSLHGERKCYQPRKYCFENIGASRVYDESKSMIENG